MNTTLYPQAQLLACYDRLNQALQALARLLRASQLPIWVPLTLNEKDIRLDPREKAVQLFCDIWYVDGQDGRATRSCHGLIAADDAILAACEQVNHAKAAFRAAIAAVRKTPDTSALGDLNQRDSQLRQDLNSKGIARLHLKQCYRLIPLVREHPSRAGFNWYCSGRSIRRLSVKQVVQMLVKAGLDKPHIALQYDLIRQLEEHTALAQVQQQAPLMRANLRFDQCPDPLRRQAMNLSLPLVFRYRPDLAFPDHNEPSLSPPTNRQRKVRSDRRIEDIPFLPTLRIHRYLTDCPGQPH